MVFKSSCACVKTCAAALSAASLNLIRGRSSPLTAAMPLTVRDLCPSTGPSETDLTSHHFFFTGRLMAFTWDSVRPHGRLFEHSRISWIQTSQKSSYPCDLTRVQGERCDPQLRNDGDFMSAAPSGQPTPDSFRSPEFHGMRMPEFSILKVDNPINAQLLLVRTWLHDLWLPGSEDGLILNSPTQ